MIISTTTSTFICSEYQQKKKQKQKAEYYSQKPKNLEVIQGEGALGGYTGALFYMAWNFMREILNTIFANKNLVFDKDRSGLTR
jgi:hypothetical protein